MKTFVDLVLQMALENPSWGIHGSKEQWPIMGHEVGRGTIANILREYGIDGPFLIATGFHSRPCQCAINPARRNSVAAGQAHPAASRHLTLIAP
jgi:hypothetical protein